MYDPAEVAELVDALDLGSSGETRPGSSPGFRILFLPTYRDRLLVGLEILGLHPERHASLASVQVRPFVFSIPNVVDSAEG
jgi:hypothetical protein